MVPPDAIRGSRRVATAAAAAAILGCLIATSAGAQQISFTQTASGGAGRTLENNAPAIASRTDGTSLAPIAGTVTKTDTGRVFSASSVSPFSSTPATTRTVTTGESSAKDGLLIERRITATVGRGYGGTAFPSPSAGVPVASPVGRLDETFTLSAPTLGLAGTSITQIPYDWSCVAGPCAPSINFTGTSPAFVLRDIKTYDPNRFDPANPTASNIFVDRGGGPVTLTYAPIATPTPGGSTFASASISTTVTVERVFRPWQVNEALDLDVAASGGEMAAIAAPRFGFTMAEVAALGGYRSFNWLQRITGMEVGGVLLTHEAERIAEFGRGLGIDPAVGANPALRALLGVVDADASPLYYDLSPIAGRAGYATAANLTDAIARFLDRPQLFERGREVAFETSLVGVRDDGSFDVLSELFADDRLTFRWSYEQTADFIWPADLLALLGLTVAPSEIAAMLQNLDSRFAGGGVARFLGFGRAGTVVDPVDPVDPGPIGVPAPASGAVLALGTIVLMARRRVR